MFWHRKPPLFYSRLPNDRGAVSRKKITTNRTLVRSTLVIRKYDVRWTSRGVEQKKAGNAKRYVENGHFALTNEN